MDAMRATREDMPTTELVGGVVGDRCANCQSPLAADQRYCVSCGERRGRPRFSYEQLAAQAASAASEPPSPRSQGARFSSATTLVAGVATLLIAMGVGVLIGHNSNSGSPARASAPEVIRLSGTGGAASGSGLGSANPARTNKSKGGTTHLKKVVVTAKVAKAANSAASKVLGKSGNLASNVSQTVGGSCSGGAGCQGGKFTGNFFPGG